MSACCSHRAFTLLRHLPPYSVPLGGCKKAEKGGGAGEPVRTIKLHAILVQETGGQRAHRARFVGATSGGRRRCIPVLGQCGEKSPVTSSEDCPSHNLHPTSLQAWKRPEIRGRSGGEDLSSVSGGGHQRAPRLELSESKHKTCVVFSEPPYFDINHNTFSLVQF